MRLSAARLRPVSDPISGRPRRGAAQGNLAETPQAQHRRARPGLLRSGRSLLAGSSHVSSGRAVVRFQAPTLRAGGTSDDSWVGNLPPPQPGRQMAGAGNHPGRRFSPPLFIAHGLGGSLLSFVELANALGPEQPVYGLQLPAFHRRASSRSENTCCQLREAGARDSAVRPLQPCRAFLRRLGRFRDGLPAHGARGNRGSIGAFGLRSQYREGCPIGLSKIGIRSRLPCAARAQSSLGSNWRRISCPQDHAPQDKNQKLAGGTITPSGIGRGWLPDSRVAALAAGSGRLSPARHTRLPIRALPRECNPLHRPGRAPLRY